MKFASYSYISYHYPENGEYPMSGGLCLTESANQHYAFPLVLGKRSDVTLVHVLTHGYLTYYVIPTWLNEA